MGRIRGFQEAVGEPTGPISQHSLKALNYKRITGIGFDEFNYRGTILFKNLYETFSAQTNKMFLKRDSRLTEFMLVMKPIYVSLSQELSNCHVDS